MIIFSRGTATCANCGQNMPPNTQVDWDPVTKTIKHEPECQHTPVVLSLACGHTILRPYLTRPIPRRALCADCRTFQQVLKAVLEVRG